MYREIKFDIMHRIGEKEWLRKPAMAWRWTEDPTTMEKVLIATDEKDISYKIDWEHTFLLQSTEMFDKDGLTIYHGDILKNAEGKHFEVFYALGSFFIVENEDGDRVFLSDDILSDMEFAGNIFNNSELILKEINEEEFNKKLNENNNESTQN